MESKNHIYIKGAGIFSLVSQLIRYLYLCEKDISDFYFENLNDWVYNGVNEPQLTKYTIFNKLDKEYDPNVLNMFDFVLDQKRKGKYTRSVSPYPLCGLENNLESPVYKLIKQGTKKIKLKKKLEDRIDKEALSINFKNCLGVHLRLTDMNVIHAKDYGTLTFNDYVNNIKDICKLHPDIDNIFIASDNNESLEKLKNINFGREIRYVPNLLRTEAEDGDCSHLQALNMHKEFFWHEAFLETYLLSKCKYLLHRVSSVASTALVLSDSITKSYQINKLIKK